jgi:hypothetical protein
MKKEESSSLFGSIPCFVGLVIYLVPFAKLYGIPYWVAIL